MIDEDSHPFSCESVTIIDYSDSKLSTIPRFIIACPILVSLSLSRNNLISVSLDGLLHLKFLDISMNRSSHLSLSRLPSLKVLQAHGNSFSAFSDVSKSLLSVSSSLEDLTFQTPVDRYSSSVCCDPQYLYRIKTTLPRLLWLDGVPLSAKAAFDGFVWGVDALEVKLAKMINTPVILGEVPKFDMVIDPPSISLEFDKVHGAIEELELMT